jgi:hypothetical protein
MVDIETLKQMTIGQIKDLEISMNKIGDVIDQKKELLKVLYE